MAIEQKYVPSHNARLRQYEAAVRAKPMAAVALPRARSFLLVACLFALAHGASAQPAQGPATAGKAGEREQIERFQADDRVLETAMRTAQCGKVEAADLLQCERLEKKAFDLKRRLDQFERDAASHRAAGEPALLMPVLQSWTHMRVGDNRAIVDVDANRAAAATAKSDAATAAMAARPPGAVDALFKEAIASADAETRVRAQRDADKRAAAAAEKAALTDPARAAQEQADAQSMQSAGVGEVFALADRLESEQQPDAARKAFRSVIARFPDHPLAAAAATRLFTASTTPGATALNLAQKGHAAAPDSCDTQVADFDAELARLNERKPANASSIAMLQMVMYVSSKSLSLGKGICSGDRREDELTNGMQAAFDGAQRACAGISASAADCVARAPSWPAP